MTIQDDIKKRRTFAIISHPDAGKTTITEQLLYLVEKFVKLVLLKVKKQGTSQNLTGWISKTTWYLCNIISDAI